MDVVSILAALVAFLLGIVITSVSTVLQDVISTPYYKWKDERKIKKENIEIVSSLIEDFCSDWELFKYKTIPSVDLRKDLIQICRDIHSLIAKNEEDFTGKDTGKAIKKLCQEFVNLCQQDSNSADDYSWGSKAEEEIDTISTEFEKIKENLKYL